MVVGLLALSLVMIAGGIAAVVQGFPYVRLESGLALVISGATAASAGVILLGLSAVVHRLKRIEGALASPRFAGAPAVAESFAVMPGAPASSPAEAAGLTGPVADAPEPSLDPVEPARERPGPVEPETTPSHVSGGEPRSRLASPAPSEATPDPSPPASGEEDLFADRNPLPATSPEREEPVQLRSSLDDAPSPDPSPAEPREKAADPPQVVGTYSSGGNSYVMYADGTIEADTPRGRFTFDSLEELKAFVEAGGENDARGAA